MGYRLRMSEEIHDWLADLGEEDPGAAQQVGQALIALINGGPGLGPPLVVDLAPPAPPGGSGPAGAEDPEQIERQQAARRQLAEAAAQVEATRRQITELEAAEAALGERRWRALGDGDTEAAGQAVDELAGVQARLAGLRRVLPGMIDTERRLRQHDPGAPGPDAGGGAPAESAATPEDELTARLREISAEIERELAPPSAEGLLELRPGAPGDSDTCILFAAEPPGTALLIAVLEGHAAVSGRRDQAVKLSAEVLRRARAGQAPEAAAYSFGDAAAFAAEFFPGGAGQVAAGAAALTARAGARTLAEQRNRLGLTREQVAERMSVRPERVSAIEHAAAEAAEVRALAGYVEALGGRLEIVADFGGERVVLR